MQHNALMVSFILRLLTKKGRRTDMYDLLILTFHQKRASRIRSEGVCVKALSEKADDLSKYYCDIWPFINNAYGILYKLYTRDGLGEFECCDELFQFSDLSNDSDHFPVSCFKTDHDDYDSIMLSDQRKNDFMNAVESLLSCSPVSTIAFLCRGQASDQEIVLGTFSFDEFSEMLKTGAILTNVCYLVRK